MDDMWHRIGRVIRISNLGTLIYFILNILLIIFVFFPNGINTRQIIILTLIYFAFVLISLSPLGEWFIAFLSGAREIKRIDIKIKLIPLLEIVYDKAKRLTPSLTNSIHLKMIKDDAPNAFAVGRKTICVTEGLLDLSDDEIMAVFAHEIGHLAYRHSEIQLLIGGGNIIITSFLTIIKIISWMFTVLISAIAGVLTKRLWVGVLVAAISSVSALMIWAWTKFCMLFLMWSMRQNELLADEYALRLGYGEELAKLLDGKLLSPPKSGFFRALFSSHPDNSDRIAHLQELGANYSRFMVV